MSCTFAMCVLRPASSRFIWEALVRKNKNHSFNATTITRTTWEALNGGIQMLHGVQTHSLDVTGQLRTQCTISQAQLFCRYLQNRRIIGVDCESGLHEPFEAGSKCIFLRGQVERELLQQRQDDLLRKQWLLGIQHNTGIKRFAHS